MDRRAVAGADLRRTDARSVVVAADAASVVRVAGADDASYAVSDGRAVVRAVVEPFAAPDAVADGAPFPRPDGAPVAGPAAGSDGYADAGPLGRSYIILGAADVRAVVATVAELPADGGTVPLRRVRGGGSPEHGRRRFHGPARGLGSGGGGGGRGADAPSDALHAFADPDEGAVALPDALHVVADANVLAEPFYDRSADDRRADGERCPDDARTDSVAHGDAASVARAARVISPDARAFDSANVGADVPADADGPPDDAAAVALDRRALARAVRVDRRPVPCSRGPAVSGAVARAVARADGAAAPLAELCAVSSAARRRGTNVVSVVCSTFVSGAGGRRRSSRG